MGSGHKEADMDEEKKKKIRDIQMRANEAKDRLHEMVIDLEEMGQVRRAKSLMTIIYRIEAWQHT